MAIGNIVSHFREDFIGMAFIVTDAGNAQGGHLPQIEVVNLGYRDIELVGDSAGDRFHDLPLALERTVLRQTKPEPTNTDVHFLILTYSGLGLGKITFFLSANGEEVRG